MSLSAEEVLYKGHLINDSNTKNEFINSNLYFYMGAEGWFNVLGEQLTVGFFTFNGEHTNPEKAVIKEFYYGEGGDM